MFNNVFSDTDFLMLLPTLLIRIYYFKLILLFILCLSNIFSQLNSNLFYVLNILNV